MDVAGKERRAIELPPGTGEVQRATIEIEGIASGVYMLELRNGGERSAVPIVIRK
jgi:hypothetical protein